MDQSIDVLMKTNKVEATENYFLVYLNKPKDFIYQVSDIIIKNFKEGKTKEIICSEIPEKIIMNMEEFDYMAIEDYVRFLEDNLLIFFKGQIPQQIKAEPVLRPRELPAHYKFNIHKHSHPNVFFDAYKRYISILICEKLNLTVKCNKCEEIQNNESSNYCKKCSSEVEVAYLPVFESDFLGFLALSRCTFICFNPAEFQFNCSECLTNYKSKEVGIGETYKQNCYVCFKENHFKIDKISFFQKQEIKIKEGQELLNKGACKHYKNSFRWFRFPCCRLLYPCDVCHDQETGHKAVLANKMICGLCSKEQSVKKECECGLNLKKSTQFWEGGKGNRNKATLSRKDSKKYK